MLVRFAAILFCLLLPAGAVVRADVTTRRMLWNPQEGFWRTSFACPELFPDDSGRGPVAWKPAPLKVDLSGTSPSVKGILRLAWDSVSGPPGCLPGELWPPVANGPGNEPAHLELPPAPGGDRLVCSGLLMILSIPAFRSARQWNFGAVPAWLHTAGPDQIGHRVTFDVVFSGTPLPAWAVPEIDCPRSVRPERGREFNPRLCAQCRLPVAAPRGPPNRS